MRKRLFSLLLALALCMGLSVPAFAANPIFTDVPADYWAYTQIERAYADGVVNGTGNNQYSPEAVLKLSHFIVIMTRAFYCAEVDASTASGEWYAKNLEVATAHGLMAGLGDYDMDAGATRYQMAAVMAAIMADQGAQMPTADELAAASTKIADYAAIPDAYKDAVATVFHLGIISGVDAAGTFNGNGGMKRSHCAVIYCRLQDALASLNSGTSPQEPTDDVKAPESAAEVTAGLDEEAMYTINKYHVDVVTDANTVNEIIDAGKSNAYPTLGYTDEANQNAQNLCKLYNTIGILIGAFVCLFFL